MIVRANGEDRVVNDDWCLWPMWSVCTAERSPKPLGYVKARTETEAISKAIERFNTIELICEPYDGVL